jgi:hypothetical protein
VRRGGESCVWIIFLNKYLESYMNASSNRSGAKHRSKKGLGAYKETRTWGVRKSRVLDSLEQSYKQQRGAEVRCPEHSAKPCRHNDTLKYVCAHGNRGRATRLGLTANVCHSRCEATNGVLDILDCVMNKGSGVLLTVGLSYGLSKGGSQGTMERWMSCAIDRRRLGARAVSAHILQLQAILQSHPHHTHLATEHAARHTKEPPQALLQLKREITFVWLEPSNWVTSRDVINGSVGDGRFRRGIYPLLGCQWCQAYLVFSPSPSRSYALCWVRAPNPIQSFLLDISLSLN